MIAINSAIGVLVFLVGVVLTASVAVNICTQKLLTRCRDMLDFAFIVVARNDKELERNRLEQEGYKHEGTE